jgi:hypothetical protein
MCTRACAADSSGMNAWHAAAQKSWLASPALGQSASIRRVLKHSNSLTLQPQLAPLHSSSTAGHLRILGAWWHCWLALVCRPQ